MAKVWPPGTSENNYRAEIVLDIHPHAFHKYIATFRDDRDNKELFSNEGGHRETPEKAFYRLDRKIQKQYLGESVAPLRAPQRNKDKVYYTRLLQRENILSMCSRVVMRVCIDHYTGELLEWKSRDYYGIKMEPSTGSSRLYQAVVKRKDTGVQIVKGGGWVKSKDKAYKDLLKEVKLFVKKQPVVQKGHPS